MPPGRRFAVLTCMDARLDPAKFAGLAEGDAHVIRNAGGRVSPDVLRSLALATHLLGVDRICVVQHTRCRMVGTTNEEIRSTIGPAADGWDFLPIEDQERTLAADVEAVRQMASDRAHAGCADPVAVDF